MPTYIPEIVNGFHFKKEQPAETHIMVHGYITSIDTSVVMQNETAIPSAGSFNATALLSYSGSNVGRFSNAPNGQMVFCNGLAPYIWGGDETKVARFVFFDPDNEESKWDFTTQVQNSLTDALNVASFKVISGTAGGIDANCMLMLHCDGTDASTTFTDSSPTTVHTVTAVGNAQIDTAQKKFGTASGLFDGTGDWLTIPDDPDFDFSTGVFTIDYYGRLNSPTGHMTIYYQQTDASNHFHFYLDKDPSSSTWRPRLGIVSAGEVVVDIYPSTRDIDDSATWNHIEVSGDGSNYYILLNGVLKNVITNPNKPANYTGLVYIGSTGSAYPYKGWMDEFRVSNVCRHTSSFSLREAAYSTDATFAYMYVGATRPLDGVKFYIGTANTVAGTLTGYYWNGTAWTTLASLSDGTALSGKPFGQTGWVTFTSTEATAKVKVIDEICLYWYKFIADDVATTTTITQITVDAPFQKIKDLWDGFYRGILSCFHNDTSVSGGLDSDTVLMLHMDGEDGSTTFNDSSPITPHTVTANGDAQLDTAQQFFGYSSAYFDGVDDFLTVPDHADFNFTGDIFTIDARFLLDEPPLNADMGVYAQGTDASNYMYIFLDKHPTNDWYRPTIIINDGGVTQTLAPDWGLYAYINTSIPTFTHFEWSGDGTNYYIYCNGVKCASVPITSSVANYTGEIHIGILHNPVSGTSSPYKGWIDEFRVSTVCRNTGISYSNPTIAYTSGETITTLKDYTINVFDDSYYETNNATYMDISNMTEDEYLLAGFIERSMGFHIEVMPGYENIENNTVMTVSRWNGSAWVVVTGFEDGTISDNTSLAKSGTVSWYADQIGTIAEYKKSMLRSVELYYYKIQFNQPLSSSVRLFYIGGIPAQENLLGWKFPFFSKNRVWLGCNEDNKKNAIRCSKMRAPDVWNGDDTIELYFGDESDILAACNIYSQLGSNIYDIILVFKAREIWSVVGNTPEDFQVHQVTKEDGCVAPLTLDTMSVNSEGVMRPIAIWQGIDGIYMYDNTNIIPIYMDIRDRFDRRASTRMDRTKIGDSVGFFDHENKEYHWLYASNGSSTLDKEMVYDVKRNRWFEIDRGEDKALLCGFTVMDTDYNTYNYGAIAGGYLERLEYGTTFDGNAIVHEFHTGDFPLLVKEPTVMYETLLRYLKLTAVAKTVTANNITITHYGDAYSTGTAFTLSPQKANHRVIKFVKSFQSGSGVERANVLHSVKASLSTSDETYGFEPIAISGFYKLIREDVRE